MATGVTTHGTAWTTYSATVAGAGTVRWGGGDSFIGLPGRLAFVIPHGAGGGSDDFETIPSWKGMREFIIDSGHVWIEGTGAATSGAGLQPWNNPATQLAYELSFQYVAGVIDIDRVFIVGRSMGGLVSYYLATQSTVVAPYVIGVIINSGVSDLNAAYLSGNWTAAMQIAFGATDDASFYANSAGRDPMGLPVTDFDGLNILQVVGDADTLVIPDQHGLAMRARLADHPRLNLLDVRLGGDHSTGNGSYFEVKAMTSFVTRVLEGGQRVPVTVYARDGNDETTPVVGMYAKKDGTIQTVDQMVTLVPD